MASKQFTITTDKGMNSKYPVVTSAHVIASATSVGYKIERFKFVIPSTNNGETVTSATLAGIRFNKGSGGLLSVAGGQSVEANLAITASATSWSSSGSANPGNERAIISNFKSRATLTFTKTDYSGCTFNATNNTSLKPGTYYLYLYTNSSSYNERYIDNTGAITMSLTFDYISYTKCKPPTAITIRNIFTSNPASSQDYFRPNTVAKDIAEIKWSGAKAGTSNTITGYKIYWGVGSSTAKESDITYSNSTTLKTTSTSASIQITIGYQTRGNKIFFKVQTLGSAGSSWYSDKSSVSCVAIINSLPFKPQIWFLANGRPVEGDGEIPIVKSTENKITILGATNCIKSGKIAQGDETRPGGDNDVSQITSIAYKKPGETSYTSWNDCSVDIKLDMKGQGEETVYEFYTYDGLEYSSESVKVRVQRNTKPSVSLTAVANEQIYYSEANDRDYSVKPSVRAAASGGLSGNNQYAYYLYSDNNDDHILEVTGQGETYTFEDVRAYIKPSNKNIPYTVGVKRNDGLEDSEIVKVKASDITESWFISQVPQVKKYYNQYNSNNKAGTFNDEYTYFEKEVRVVFTNDDGYNWAGFGTDDYTEYFHDFDASNKPYGEILTFTKDFNLNNSLGTVNATYTVPGLKKILKLENTSLTKEQYNFKFGMETYHVFEPNREEKGGKLITKLSMYNFLNMTFSNNANIFDEDYLMAHGLTKESGVVLSLYLDEDINKAGLDKNHKIEDLKYLDANTIYFDISSDDMWDTYLNKNIDNHNNTVSGYFLMKFTNVFGNDILFTENNPGAKSKKFDISYEEVPEVVEFNLYAYKQKAEGDEQIIDLSTTSNIEEENKIFYYLKEKTRIKASLIIKSYNYNPNVVISSVKDNGDIDDYPKKALERDESTILLPLSPGNPHYYKLEWFFTDFESESEFGFGKIEEDYYSNFKINITTDAENAPLKNYYYKETSDLIFLNKRHTNSTAIISDSNYTPDESNDSNSIIAFKCKISDFGVDETLKDFNKEEKQVCAISVELKYRSPSGRIDTVTNVKDDHNIQFTKEELDIQFTHGMGEDSYGYITATIVTKLADIYGNLLTEYKTDTNEIVIYNISPTVAYRRNHIGINTRKFQNDDGILYMTDTADRSIIYLFSSDHTATVDIKTGIISGLIIDGGTWNTSTT